MQNVGANRAFEPAGLPHLLHQHGPDGIFNLARFAPKTAVRRMTWLTISTPRKPSQILRTTPVVKGATSLQSRLIHLAAGPFRLWQDTILRMVAA